MTGIVLLVLRVLASASSIVAKRPDAKEAIDKLVPFQGWIGLACCLWGVWIVINAVLNLNWLGIVPIWWLTFLATGVLEFALGLLLGYALLSQFLLSKNPEATKRGEEVRALPDDARLRLDRRWHLDDHRRDRDLAHVTVERRNPVVASGSSSVRPRHCLP